MSDCSLQLATLQEAAHLAQRARELIETGLAHAWTAARIARQIEHPESVVLTAKVAGELAGFAVMQFGSDSAHLNLLAVEPAQQRRGIGRALVAWLEETARTAGTFLVALELRATRRAAHAFYTALGYRETGRAPGYYQGVEEAIRMARDLRIDCSVTRAPKS